MAIDIETRLRIFFASAPQNKRVIPVIQIQHSEILVPVIIWKEALPGQIVLENGQSVAVESANFTEQLAGTPAHLDQEFTFTISTVGIEQRFRDILDAIPIDTEEKISLTYREYLSDDLTIPQAVARLQVEGLSYQEGAATISAVSPRLNITRTGELYAPRDVPMLRGFL